MITKKELKRDISKLLNICIEQCALLETYKKSVEESKNTIEILRRELQSAKRNEPIFTSDRYELKALREKVRKAEKEAAHYKAFSEARRESNDALRAQIDRLKKELEKAQKPDKKKQKAE